MATSESVNNEKHNFVIENKLLKGSSFTNEFEDYNIGKLILDSLNSKPEHIGQINAETGEQTTFSEMKKRSVQCALWLKKHGVGPNDIVTICTNNQLDDYVPALATFFLGAIFNPWYYGIDLQEARRLMQLLHPRLIFTCESAVESLLKAAKEEKVRTKIVVIERNSKLLSLHDILNEQKFTEFEINEFRSEVIADPRKTSMILLSSGTVGPSKCVEQSAGSCMQYFYENLKTSSRTPLLCLWYASLHWYCGTIYFLESIINGHTRLLHENYDHEETCRVIDKFKVEILELPISLVKDLLRHNVFQRHDLSSIKCISVWGTYLSRHVVEELKKHLPNVHIDNSYGLTEVGSRCNDPQRKSTKLGSLGFVKSNMQMKVIDPKTGKILGPNEIGEFCFKSPTAMTGYYKDPEATKKVIDDEGWVHSGDLGYYDQKGEIILTERLSEMMNFRDNDVSPTEIEEVLVAHPEVMEACVVPVPHSDDIHHPMAFVKKIPGSKITEEELVKVTTKLGESKKLRGGVRFVEEMPRTRAGVIHRKNLKEMAKALAFV